MRYRSGRSLTWLKIENASWRVERRQQPCHSARMSDEKTYPYTLDVVPSKTKPGQFEWTIRERGKLIQRSDRLLGSEKAARKSGMA